MQKNSLHWLIAMFAMSICISCSVSPSQYKYKYFLQQQDSLMLTEYAAVWDTLQHFKPRRLSQRNQAMYNLLYTIAGDKNVFIFPDDSLITQSYNFFKRTCDYRNYARSALYRGIVYARIDTRDTLSYIYIKEAQQICDLHIPEGEFELKGHIHFYLANYFENAYQYTKAESLYREASAWYEKDGSLSNYVFAQTRYVISLLNQAKNQDAIMTLHLLETNVFLPDISKCFIYETISTYFFSIGDDKMGEEYRLKKLGINTVPNTLSDRKQKYAADACYFYKTHQADSALYYAYQIETILSSDSIVPQDYTYYDILSLVYQDVGQYEKALSSKQKAYNMLNQLWTTEMQRKPIPFGEWATESPRTSWQVLLLLGLLTACSFTLGFFYLSTRRKNKRDVENWGHYKALLLLVAAHYSSALDKWANKAQYLTDKKSINEICTLEKVCRASFREQMYNQIIQEFSKTTYRSSLRVVVPILKKQGFSNKEIAALLCTPESSIRSANSEATKE